MNVFLALVRAFRRVLLAGLCLALAALGARADTVTALGRVVPAGGVIDVIPIGGDIVEAVLVKEGEWVEAGAVLARLRSLPVFAARLQLVQTESAAQLAVALGDTALATERLAATTAELKIADERLQRIRAMKDNAIISPDKIEDRQLQRAEVALRLAVARDALTRARQAEEVARRVGASRLAEARLLLAERDLRAPMKTRVLKILTSPGASTNHGVAFKLGDTTTMHVIAEIYEGDALKIKAGQKATVTSPALPKKLSGTVEHTSVMLYRNSLQSLDPNSQTSQRIIEAVIRMEDRATLERLVFLQVDVTVHL